MKCKHDQEWSRFIGGWNQVVIRSWTLCSAWRAAQFKRFIFTHSRASPSDVITRRGGNGIPLWDILNAPFIITAMHAILWRASNTILGLQNSFNNGKNYTQIYRIQMQMNLPLNIEHNLISELSLHSLLKDLDSEGY